MTRRAASPPRPASPLRLLLPLLAVATALQPSPPHNALSPSSTAIPRNQYGTHEYWDEMYQGRGDHDAEEYSWYYGWDVVKKFWEPAVPDRSARVLLPGIGNDPVLLDLVAAGWTDLTAFDYSASAVARQEDLLSYDARAAEAVSLHVWDATALPEALAPPGSFDAVLEKGALDAIYLSGEGQVEKAAKELARVLKRGGVCVSFSGVVPEDVRRAAFPEGGEGGWRWVRDGAGDLQAGCFVLERL